MQYTITLADGRELTGLLKNGDNFVSSEKVDENIFKDNLSVMAVSDGETEEIFSPCYILNYLVQRILSL